MSNGDKTSEVQLSGAVFDKYGRILNPNYAAENAISQEVMLPEEKTEFHFYHISRDASDEKVHSFESGIRASGGTGYGGQSSGFYCWTNEEQANKCFAGWAIGADAEWAKKTFGLDTTLQNGDALKIEVTVPASYVKFPDFQLDNEQHPNKNRGRERSIWLDFWEAQKHIFNDKYFTFEDTAHDNNYKGIAWDDERHCPVLLMSDGLGNEKRKYVETTRAEDSELTQKINDYFCNFNSEFRANYDQLVKAVAQNEPEVKINGRVLHIQNLAVKYCGLETLDNFKVSKMHTNFGTDEKLSDARTVTYGNHKVSFKEEPLFMTDKALDNKLSRLRRKIARKTDDVLKKSGIGAALKVMVGKEVDFEKRKLSMKIKMKEREFSDKILGKISKDRTG